VGPSMEVEVGRRYQTRINASTTAAAMMSTLFVSIGPPLFSCPTKLAPLCALRQVSVALAAIAAVLRFLVYTGVEIPITLPTGGFLLLLAGYLVLLAGNLFEGM